MYEANFGNRPFRDINEIAPNEIPDHDILLAAFHVTLRSYVFYAMFFTLCQKLDVKFYQELGGCFAHVATLGVPRNDGIFFGFCAFYE